MDLQTHFKDELSFSLAADVTAAAAGSFCSHTYTPFAQVACTFPCMIRSTPFHVQVTLVEDHSCSVSSNLSPAKVDMYLHQNFKPCLRYAQGVGHDLLAPGRKVRLTGYVQAPVLCPPPPQRAPLCSC